MSTMTKRDFIMVICVIVGCILIGLLMGWIGTHWS
jgi:hypothetical protein